MKPSKGRSKRDVETCIKETSTRTELCVTYSLSEINTNIPIDQAKLLSDSNSRLLDGEYLTNVVQRLYVAREILNPAIDEIITTATIMSQTQLTAARNSPLCSLSKQDFQGALKASQIFNAINQELTYKYNNKPLLIAKNFRFPLTKPIVNLALLPNQNQHKNIVEVADRIYIDKELMLKLIELYEILGETIQRLREKESVQRSEAAASPPLRQQTSLPEQSSASRKPAARKSSLPQQQTAPRKQPSPQQTASKAKTDTRSEASISPSDRSSGVPIESPKSSSESAGIFTLTNLCIHLTNLCFS